MIIKKITMSNFRQYKGKQCIEFSSDKEKNVTVILGKNSSGKTTLIQAFNWCLYEETLFKKQSEYIMNLDVMDSIGLHSSQTVYVEVELIHENISYTIRRSQDITKSDFDKFRVSKNAKLEVEYKEDNGETQEIPSRETEDTINKILPKALKNYFFFEGESITNINNKGDVVEAVRGLMGLDIIQQAVDHFDPSKSSSVISKLRKELDIGQDIENGRLNSTLTKKKDDLEGYKKRAFEEKGEIEFFERRKADFDKKLLENKDVKQKQVEKLRAEKDITFFKNNQENTEKRIKKDFNQDAYKFFALPLYEKAKKVIANAKMDGEGIPEMHSKAIDYILKRGKCICGCDLKMNQGAVQNIKYEQSLLPPQHIGTIIRNYNNLILQSQRDVSTYADTIQTDYKLIRENANKLDDKNQEFQKLSDSLKGNSDVGKIEKENADNTLKLKDKRDLLSRVQVNIGATQQRIKSLQKDIDDLVIATEKNAKIYKYIAYATETYNWFMESYDKAEKSVKLELYQSINDKFNKMYHGKRKLVIDDKYKITLVAENGNASHNTDTSSGTDTVKNFAFIAGLVELARKKAKKKDSESEAAFNTEPYPIVMDAPFSNADEIHIPNIIKVIAEVAEQVILVVMKKDWKYAEPVVREKVGILYEIKKYSETNSAIRRSQ